MHSGAPNPQTFWVLAALFALATAYAVYRFFASVRRDRYLADTPLVRIRSAAQGYVRIEGRAAPAPGESAVAPLSGRDCVWWQYELAERRRNSKGQTEWCTLERAASVAPFALSDADAQCLVGPVGADVTPTAHNVWYGEEPRPSGPPPQSRTLLVLEQSYRYTERLIAPGTHLSVLGELRSHSEVTEVEDQVRTLLDSWKTDQPALLKRFDADHDGRLNATEWEAARAAARAEVEGGSGAALARTSIVAQTTHGEPFLIAPLDGAQLVQREQRYAMVALLASVVFVALTLWAMHRALTLPLVSLAAP